MLTRLRSGASVLLAAVLVWTAPGLGAHAFAARVVAPVRAAPIGASVGGVGAVGAQRLQLTGPAAPAFALPAARLGGSFGVLSAPKAQAPLALPQSAVPTAPAAPSAEPAAAMPSAVRHGYTRPPLYEGAFGRASFGALRRPTRGAADAEQSLGTVRGRSNKLGLRFRELAAAFAEKRGGDVAAGPARRIKRLAPVDASDARAGKGLPLGPYAPRAEAAAPAAAPAALGLAPTPLTLRRSGLRIAVIASARAASRAAAAPLGLRHLDDFSTLGFPQEFDSELGKARRQLKPEPRAEDQAAGKSRIGLGRVALMLIGSLVVAQVGVEAFGAAMPSLIQKTFGDFTVVAQLAIAGSFASIAGRQIASFVVRKLGLKNTYVAANGVRLLSMSLMAGMLAVGVMPLWAMGVFYALNGAMLGISMTALESIVPAIQGQDAAKLEKFWTWEQTILELAAIATPIATGAIVAGMGFLPALVAFPVAMLISLGIVWKTLRIPQRMEQIRKADLRAAAKTGRGFFGKLSHGARMVWSRPALRYAFLAYTFYVMLNPFLYTLLAPAFGLRLMEMPELAASVQGFLTGFYSLGGLLGGLLMIAEQARTKKAKAALRAEAEAERGELSDEAWAEEIKPWENERLRKSMLRWLLFGVGGLGLIASLAFPMGTLGSAVALPSLLSWASGATPQALALMLFGIAQVVSVLKLRSYFQSKVPAVDDSGAPADNMADAMGFFGSASLLISTLGLMGLKMLFQTFDAFTPFVYLAWAMAPLAVVYLFLRWRLSRASAPA